MKHVTLIFLSAILCGCSKSPSSQLDYKQEDIKSSGIIEARAYLSDLECPAVIYAEKYKQTSGNEAAALTAVGIIIGKKLIDEAIKRAAKSIKTYGDNLSSPFTMPVFLAPGETSLSEAKCLIVGYGEFGGEGENNVLANNKLPWSLYSSTELGQELNGNLGFAMQIRIKEVKGKIYFTPFSLFYPRKIRPYGVHNHHSITVGLDFKDAKLIMEFGDIKQGSYFTYQAIKAHTVFAEKDKLLTNNMTISITEGPDSQLLGNLIAAVGSDDTAAQVSSTLQTKVDEKFTSKQKK
ncbi:MAG: hypothetical protein RSC10_09725 [Longicatena sp.]